jgi:pyruvate/2-oxoglutarate dehydrogenase complex dihydrolipoamide acyltransferase (E2) component
MTFDHRALDGADVARFLSRVAENIAQRDWASEI